MNKEMVKAVRGCMVATWNMAYQGVLEGARVLRGTGQLDQAIMTAVKMVENNENFISVGYGGLPNADGEVELDAAYMNGDTLGVGAVLAVKNIKNPIEVACDLSRYNRCSILAAEGAQRYAQVNGFTFQNMLTVKSLKHYKEKKALNKDMQQLMAYEGHDTVCVIARDQKGSLACGVSTSGLFMKHPGRIGDSPLIGSGFYADSQAGSAAATGVGEDIMKGCLSFAIVERIRNGQPVQTTCEEVLMAHVRSLNQRGHAVGSMSVIAMDKDGYVGAATTKDYFPFIVAGEEDDCDVYIAVNDQGNLSVFKPDQAWMENCYKGD